MRLARKTVIGIGLSLVALALSATGASAAATRTCVTTVKLHPFYIVRVCTLQVTSSRISPTEPAAMTGSGFQPGSAVAVSLGSSPAEAATADAAGQFNRPLVVPKGLAAGQYDLRARGINGDGAPYEQSAVVQVAAAPLGASPSLLADLRPGAGLAAGGTAATSSGTVLNGSLTAAHDAAAPGVDGLNPLAGVGGGLALVGVGAGAVVAARRRKTAKD